MIFILKKKKKIYTNIKKKNKTYVFKLYFNHHNILNLIITKTKSQLNNIGFR